MVPLLALTRSVFTAKMPSEPLVLVPVAAMVPVLLVMVRLLTKIAADSSPFAFEVILPPIFVTFAVVALIADALPFTADVVLDIVPVLLMITVPPALTPLALGALPLAEIVPPLLLLTVLVPVPRFMPLWPPVTEAPVARLM